MIFALGTYENMKLIALLSVLVLLAVSLVAFVFVYHTKVQRKEDERNKQELKFQQELVWATTNAQEREKKRIAIELHDDVGSKLTALKFAFSYMNLPSESKENLLESLQQTIHSVRRLSNELMPSILDELGLVPAVKNLISSLHTQVPTIHFDLIAANGAKSVLQTKEVELVIYRVLQEVMTNIVKYSNASVVDVLFEQREAGVEFLINDNGDGFEPTEIQKFKPGTLGLKNINSRTQQINASLTFLNKQPGTLTTFTWHIQQK